MADKGGIFEGKSDIQNLIETLNEYFNKSSDKEGDSKKKSGGSIPKNPKVEDFQNFFGNMDLIVPTGFILLHNDLINIKSALGGGPEGEGGSSLSMEDVADKLVDKLPAIVGIIAAASVANTLIKNTSMDDVIKLMNAIPEVIGSLITNVGESVIGLARSGALAIADIMDYFNDDESIKQRRQLASTYMNLSYISMYQGMGFDVDYDPITGDVKGIKNHDMFSGEGSSQLEDGLNLGMDVLKDFTINKAATKAEAWADLIIDKARNLTSMVMDVVDIIDDEGVAEQRKKLLGLYLAAMYGQLISGMGFGVEYDDKGELRLKDKSAIEKGIDIGEDILKQGFLAVETGGVSLMIDAGADLLADTATQMAGMIGSVIDLLDGNETVKQMSEKYAGLYMQAYWANMIKDLGFDVDFENERLSGTAVSLGSLINDSMSLFSGLFGDLAEAGTKMVAGAVASQALLDSTQVKTVSEEYAALYIEAYWLSIIDTLGFAIDGEGGLYDTSTGREQRKGIFTNINEFFKGDPATQLSNSIVDKLKDNMGTVIAKMANNGDFSNSVNAYAGFLTSYFKMLKDHVIESPGTWRWSSAGSISIFNHAMAGAIPEFALSEDIKTTIVNEGRDYSGDMEELKQSLYEIKTFILRIRENVRDDIVTDVKTIAANSNTAALVAAGGSNYSRFGYGNSEPTETSEE